MLHMTESHGDNSLEEIIVRIESRFLVSWILESGRIQALLDEVTVLKKCRENISDYETKEALTAMINEITALIEDEIKEIKESLK